MTREQAYALVDAFRALTGNFNWHAYVKSGSYAVRCYTVGENHEHEAFVELNKYGMKAYASDDAFDVGLTYESVTFPID